jgi:hypothetical protein
MAKQTSKQRNHSWAVYHIRGTPAQFIGIVFDQPNEQSAIREGHRGVQGAGKSAQPTDRAAAGLSNLGSRDQAASACPLFEGMCCKTPIETIDEP